MSAPFPEAHALPPARQRLEQPARRRPRLGRRARAPRPTPGSAPTSSAARSASRSWPSSWASTWPPSGSRSRAAAAAAPEYRREVATATIQRLEAEQADLKKRIADLRGELAQAQQSTDDQSDLGRLSADLEREKLLAGTVAGQGRRHPDHARRLVGQDDPAQGRPGPLHRPRVPAARRRQRALERRRRGDLDQRRARRRADLDLLRRVDDPGQRHPHLAAIRVPGHRRPAASRGRARRRDEPQGAQEPHQALRPAVHCPEAARAGGAGLHRRPRRAASPSAAAVEATAAGAEPGR